MRSSRRWVGILLTVAIASYVEAAIIQAVIPAVVPTANRQGSTGTKFFVCNGSFTVGDSVSTDANGNCVDSGNPANTPGSTFFSSTSQAGPNDTATETSVVGTVVGSKTIAANTFVNGQVLQLEAQGYYNTPSSPDALTFKIKCGSTILGSSAIQLPSRSASNLAWRLHINLTAIGAGASGAFNANGLVDFGPSTSTTSEVYGIVNTTNVSFNFTTSCAFDVTGTWAAATMGESLIGTSVALYSPGSGPAGPTGPTGATGATGVTGPTGSGGGSSAAPIRQTAASIALPGTLTVAYLQNVVSGNTLLAFICSDQNPSGITDSLSDTWTEKATLTAPSTATMSAWSTTAASNGANTITIAGVTSAIVCGIAIIDELAGARVFDTSAGSTSSVTLTGSTAAIIGANITTANASELVFELVVGDNNSASINPLAPYVDGGWYNQNDAMGQSYAVLGPAAAYIANGGCKGTTACVMLATAWH